MTVISSNMGHVRTSINNNKLISVPIFAFMIYIICTYFPLIYTIVPLLGKIKIVLIFGVVLLVSYISTAGRYRNVGTWRNSIIIALFGYFIAITLGIFVSHDRGLTLQTIIANLKYLLVTMIMVKIIDNEKRQKLIMVIFMAGGLGMAVSTVLNYTLLGKTFVQFDIVSERALAIESGLFGDPNDLAMLFNVVLPFILYKFMKAKNKIMPLIGILMIVCAVMFTYSRGGFLGMLTVALGFLLFQESKKGRYIVIVVIVALLFWSFAPDNYKERILTIKSEAQVDEEMGKYPGRLQAWVDLLPEGLKSPLLGAGAGCSFYLAGHAIGDWHVMHNSFLQAFLETGLIGLIFFVSIFILPYKQYRHLRCKGRGVFDENTELFKFILLSIAAFAVTAFFLPQAYSPIMYFLSGTAVIQTKLCNSQSKHVSRPYNSHRSALVPVSKTVSDTSS